MNVTVTNLIQNAYNEAVIVALNYTPLTPDQLSIGLYAFNEVLGRVLIDPCIVPYWKQHDFELMTNTETYDIPYLIDVETFVFYLNQVRYPIKRSDFRQYWGSPKAITVQTLPIIYSQKRILGGTAVSVLPNPNQNYPATIYGSFGLHEASSLLQNLSEVYDQYYITYLTALTAKMLCVHYGADVPQILRSHLFEYDQLIRKRSQPLDLTSNVISTFNRSGDINYAQVNAGNGYTVTRRSWQ